MQCSLVDITVVSGEPTAIVGKTNKPRGEDTFSILKSVVYFSSIRIRVLPATPYYSPTPFVNHRHCSSARFP
jgi:hypothetical protein